MQDPDFEEDCGMILDYEFKFTDKSSEALTKMVKGFTDVMYEMWNNAMNLCPKDTGRLANSINLFKISDFHYELRDGVFYGIFCEFGTSPHIIRPVEAKALTIPRPGGRLVWRKGKRKTKFKYGGKTVIRDVIFATKVEHPGTTPCPFFRPALDIAKMRMREMMR